MQKHTSMNDSIWKDFRFIAIVDAIAGIVCLVFGQWPTAIVWFTTVFVAGVAAYCIKKMTAELEEIKDRKIWKNPANELPNKFELVIIKVVDTEDGQIDYRIGSVIDDKLSVYDQYEDCEVIGWRPIE